MIGNGGVYKRLVPSRAQDLKVYSRMRRGKEGDEDRQKAGEKDGEDRDGD